MPRPWRRASWKRSCASAPRSRSTEPTRVTRRRGTKRRRVALLRAAPPLAAAPRPRRDFEAHSSVLLPVLDEVPGQRAASSATLVMATTTHRHAERARAPRAPRQRPGVAGAPLDASWRPAAEDPRPVSRQRGRRARARAATAGVPRPTPDRRSAVTELATIAASSLDRVGAAAIERAMATVVPRGELCDALAATLEGLGEDQLAFAWTQRWLALRPGAPRAMAELLRRATELGDPVRLADAVAWVLAQPEPLAELVPQIVDGLDRLLLLDRTKARARARKALDVGNPGHFAGCAALRDRLGRLLGGRQGSWSCDRRARASPRESADRAGRGRSLVRARQPKRAKAGATSTACRAGSSRGPRSAAPRDGSCSARADALESRARESDAWLGSDGLIALTQARAQALTSMGPDAVTSAGNAWRDLGSLRWDLAGDQIGAEEAFYRAGELAPKGGVARFARDLTDFGGEEHAMYALVRPRRTRRLERRSRRPLDRSGGARARARSNVGGAPFCADGG